MLKTVGEGYSWNALFNIILIIGIMDVRHNDIALDDIEELKTIINGD